MALPKPQKPQDWLTQFGNIVLGKRVDETKDAWLLGPMGEIGGIADRFVEKIAAEENLTVERNIPSSGLIDGFQGFQYLEYPINPRIEDFYKHTLDYNLDVWTQWRPVFGSMGYLVRKLFSQRIQQLNLPRRSLDTARGLKSEIISLLDEKKNTVYRVWYRRLNSTGEVVYSGVYTHCNIPGGEKCMKIIFPLPQGSATVIMRARTDKHGNLLLESRGNTEGDPGFYFLVRDRKDILWKHFLSSFHESIFVYEDDAGTLRADHSMRLWRFRTYDLHYKITKAMNRPRERNA